MERTQRQRREGRSSAPRRDHQALPARLSECLGDQRIIGDDPAGTVTKLLSPIEHPREQRRFSTKEVRDGMDLEEHTPRAPGRQPLPEVGEAAQELCMIGALGGGIVLDDGEVRVQGTGLGSGHAQADPLDPSGGSERHHSRRSTLRRHTDRWVLSQKSTPLE